MTVLNVYEEIQQVFQLGASQIIKMIDNAQKELAGETKQLTARAELADIGSNFAWTLPAGFLEFQSIRAYDSDGSPYYYDTFEFEIEFGVLYAKSLNSTPISSIPDGISKLYLHYIKSPTAITATSGAFTIDERLHGGVKARVLQNLFATIPTEFVSGGNVIKAINLQAASYWGARYEEYRDEARKIANKRKNIPGQAIYYPYAGKFNLPKRVNDTTISTTTANALSGLDSIYDNYAIITASEGQDATVTIGQFGFSGTISGIISGNTITIVSTEDDFTPGIIRVEQANETIGWAITDSKTLTFTAETGWIKDTIILIVDKT